MTKRLTVGRLKELLVDVGAKDDDTIRLGMDAERFDYVVAVGADNDTGTLILYVDGIDE